MKRTALTLAAMLLLLLAFSAPLRAQEIVVQAPYVTVRVGAGGPGGVVVDVPFFRLRVPPRTMSAPRGLPGIELLPPPLMPSADGKSAPGADGASSPERIPPGMLPPPVPIPTDDDDDTPRREQPPPPADAKAPKDSPRREQLPPPEAPADATANRARQPLTLTDFAKNFQALAGTHEITVVHPLTQQPVNVRFTLPDDALRRVHVGRHEIEFKYKKKEVRIRFKHDGTVKVEDRD